MHVPQQENKPHEATKYRSNVLFFTYAQLYWESNIHYFITRKCQWYLTITGKHEHMPADIQLLELEDRNNVWAEHVVTNIDTSVCLL